MVFTPLHRALAMAPSPLDFSMVQAAVDGEVIENEALDWKETLPNRDPDSDVKFAKDVAAIVNAGGGMIVFGVAEVRETSAAREIVPVTDWTNAVEEKLRGWAWALVHPPVHGLRFTSLENDEGSRVIVLEIPPSFETPHFLMKKDFVRAPRRYGSRTVTMSERDIEQAYRARFEDRRRHESSLTALLDEVLEGVDRDKGIWLAAAARPISPRPSHAGRVTKKEAREMLADLSIRNPFLAEDGGLQLVELEPSVGYRKWRSSNLECVVDIHDDGSVALAHVSLPYADLDPSMDVHVRDAQWLPAHIVHLARTAATKLGVPGVFEARLTIEPVGAEPIHIRTVATSGLIPRQYLVPIHRFHPVAGVFPGTGEEQSEPLQAVRNLALDIMNQVGNTDVGEEHLKKAPE